MPPLPTPSRPRLRRLFAHTGLLLALHLGLPIATAALREDWAFNDAAGLALHLAVNTAPGRTSPPARWNVAIPGLATTGAGALRVRNTGDGGPGRRITFVDFTAESLAGHASLFLRLDAWNLAPPTSGPPPRLELGFVQGAGLLAPGLVLELAPEGLRFGWSPSAGLERWAAAPLPAVSAEPLQLRLDLHLSDRLLAFARVRDGLPDELLAIAALPPAITRLTSLRCALRGDFTAGGQPARFLDVGHIRVETDAPPANFPGLSPSAPDGLPGLLRAALGLERPDVAATDAPPRLAPAPAPSGDLLFRFFRARPDLDYHVETSTDLSAWQSYALNPGTPDALVSLLLPAVSPVETRRFVRLRIQIPAP